MKSIITAQSTELPANPSAAQHQGTEGHTQQNREMCEVSTVPSPAASSATTNGLQTAQTLVSPRAGLSGREHCH